MLYPKTSDYNYNKKRTPRKEFVYRYYMDAYVSGVGHGLFCAAVFNGLIDVQKIKILYSCTFSVVNQAKNIMICMRTQSD